MKLLWVNANFLHPTTKGGQIRTLEMVRRLHTRHEVHYAAIDDPSQPEGLGRSAEYCTRSIPLRLEVPPRGSAGFYAQAVGGLFGRLPVAVSRYTSPALRRALEDLVRAERYDRAVCDFLVSVPHFPRLEQAVLFQHNVETMIWRRHAAAATNSLRRWYFEQQASRMARFEAESCRRAARVVTVSDRDSATLRQEFGVARATAVPTGVDVDYFRPPASVEPVADLVFVGSMDWMPNVDGITWFFDEVLPRLRRRKPAIRVAVVGRTPPGRLRQYPALLTGTVPDVRPYLWGSAVCIVPLRIGGGTRLKIYEAMAARVPVVSTAIGAEGLDVEPGTHLHVADTPDEFAGRCLDLLDDEAQRMRMAQRAWDLVSSQFSWERVTRCFEDILEQAPPYST